MGEASLLRGLPIQEAICSLLGEAGSASSVQELREVLPGEASPDAACSELRRRGIPARTVMISPADLASLHLPSLVQAKDGTWILLRSIRGKRAECEGFEPYEAPLFDLQGSLTGTALDLTPELPGGRGLWGPLLRVVAGQPRTLGLLLLSSLGLQALALMPPQLTRLAIDRALPEGAGSMLSTLALGVLVVAAFQAWSAWFRQHLILHLETRVEVVTEKGFLAHLLRLPYRYLAGRPVGELLQAFSGLGAARDLLTGKVLGLAVDGVMSVAYLGVMALEWPAATVAVMLASLLLAAVSIAVGLLQARLQRREIQAQAREKSYLVELIAGIGTLKSAGAEAEGHGRWMQRLRAELGLSLQRQRLGIWNDVGLESCRQAMIVGLLIWGGRLALQGGITIGSLFAFVQMSGAFLGALMGLAGAYLSVVVLKPQLELASDILGVAPPAPPAAVPGQAGGAIMLKDVWFRYSPDSAWILKGYNLHVEPGDKLWLKAPSGFGKSTILRLIAGLHQPEQGSVSIGGLDPSSAGQRVLYLPQFVQLFSGSVMDNLRIFSGGASRDRLVAAGESSGLAALVAELPMGYDTPVPPGGGNFSGGQRQLIVLTAVMASESSLLLLDEALANLDWLTKSELIGSPWFKGRTLVYASHDAGL